MEELTKTQEKQVEKVVEAKVEKAVQAEVKKRLHQKLAEKAKSSAKIFGGEFKKQSLTAITAAFAFLIALTWRAPIQKSIDKIVASLGLTGDAVYYEYLAAIIITIIGVIALIFISRWAIEKKG